MLTYAETESPRTIVSVSVVPQNQRQHNTTQQTITTRGPLADKRPQRRITPLLNIRSKTFQQGYYYGLIEGCLSSPEVLGEKPLPATYLINNIKRYVEKGYFGGRHPRILMRSVGFALGMIHGAVLDGKTGTVREGVTTLAKLTHPLIQQAYSTARERIFSNSADACAFLNYTLSERELLEHLTERTDPIHYVPSEQDWQHTIGNLLGVLSTQLFPWTSQDAQEARERLQKYEGRNGHATYAYDPDTPYYKLLHFGETVTAGDTQGK